jgi:hypothetical protein
MTDLKHSKRMVVCMSKVTKQREIEHTRAAPSCRPAAWVTSSLASKRLNLVMRWGEGIIHTSP